MASPRKVLCTIAHGPQAALLDLAREPLEDFAARHGYDLHLQTEAEDPSRPLSWSKVPLLRRLLGEYDVAVWVDADAIFLDTSRDIAEELEDDRFLYLCMHRYEGQDAANCGILMLRSCDEALALLDDVWAMTEFVDHPWWEQAAILTQLGFEIGGDHTAATAHIVRPTARFAGTKLLHREWNSISRDPAPRPRIKHYAGLTHEQRLAGMAADLETFRSRAAARAVPSRFPATIVLPLSGVPERAWASVVALSQLDDEPVHEVVLVHDGSGRHAELLAAVGGDVKVVESAAGTFDAAVAAGVGVAEGEVVAVVSEAAAPGPGWLASLVDAACSRDCVAAVRVIRTEQGVVPVVAAFRREDLAVLRPPAGAPFEYGVAQLCVAAAEQIGQPTIIGVDQPAATVLAA
jgi:hypothetical protein